MFEDSSADFDSLTTFRLAESNPVGSPPLEAESAQLIEPFKVRPQQIVGSVTGFLLGSKPASLGFYRR
jgi:hypothetical protein